MSDTEIRAVVRTICSHDIPAARNTASGGDTWSLVYVEVMHGRPISVGGKSQVIATKSTTTF